MIVVVLKESRPMHNGKSEFILGVVPLISGVAEMGRELIQSDPSIMMGKPVIAGTRITVELILEKLAAGETIEQLLEAHPRLT
jgi:Protein of unknown function (DUF433)